MRLCFITHVMFYRNQGAYVCQGGFLRHIQEVIAPICTQLDLCVPVFETPAPPNFTPIQADNITVCPLPPYYEAFEMAALVKPIRLLKSLWPNLRRADAVCIATPNYLSIVAWVGCLLLGKPFAMTVVGDWAEQMQLAFERHGIPVAGRLAYAAHRLVTHMMVRTSNVTLTTGRVLTDMYGRHCERVVPFIGSTFRDDDLAPDIASSGREERIVLSVGRIDMGKGLRELMLASRDLIREGLNLRVRVVGDGRHRDQLECLIDELGLKSRIDLVGWVTMGSDLAREYRSADVMVLASYSEGSPKTVGEAMANGLPVVATRVGSVPDMIDHGRTGLIIPVRDAGALRDALRTILVNEPLRRSMAAAGLTRSRLFTMEVVQRTFSEAFQRFGLFPSSRS